MKKVIILLVGIVLAACSGSETYRGGWKATDSNGAKLEIIFDAKSFTVKDSLGESTKFDYTQNSVNIKNSIATYGIQLGDGRNYQINFPKANDESIALVLDNNGYVLYTMSRKDYVRYEEVFRLKQIWEGLYKKVLIYGVVLGFLIIGLKFAEYRFLIRSNSFEIYAGFIALVFTVVGIYWGSKFVKKKEILVVKEVLIQPTENFVVNENNLKHLSISKREHEVLILIAQGLSNQEVADKLFVSLNTVKTHSSKLFEKLNVQRRTQAVQEAKKLGLVP